MRILVVEDVTLVAKRVESLCLRYFDVEQCVMAFDFTTARAQLLHEDYDLVFLDININGESGFDLLTQAPVDPGKVIVVTAHQDKAVTAYELAIFDFISKPITQSRFAKVARRFLAAHSDDSASIKLNKGNTHYTVRLNDIDFLQAAGNYTEIHTIDGSVHLSEKSIGYFEKHLDRFIRCHRSYMTKAENVKSVVKLGGGQYRLKLVRNKTIPLSRGYYETHFKGWE